jgi:hypothetical protein
MPGSEADPARNRTENMSPRPLMTPTVDGERVIVA